jgi:hypothetical protein
MALRNKVGLTKMKVSMRSMMVKGSMRKIFLNSLKKSVDYVK